ncbi:MAG: diacylglycerol kinase family lipid kinase, partial [Oscillospiraceae bacterium]|nr:diacylglycerol kinase family lipid kinase [Oscillospiraceae bacterium]
PPPIGYFPMGTTNDIATSLGLPKNDTVAAARRILSGEPHPFDVGGFGENAYFAYVAAFGAFTEVSYATPQDQKRALGQLAYVLQGAAQLGKIERIPTRIEYDGGVFEGELVYGSMSNSTSVAGIVHFPESMVSLGDGMSELVLLRDPGRVDAYGELAASVISRRFDNENLIILHTRRASFHFQKPVAWTRDGEEGGKYRDVTLYNYHAPVQLIF